MVSSKELRNSSLIVSFLKDDRKVFEKKLKSYGGVNKPVYIYDALTNEGEVNYFPPISSHIPKIEVTDD